jgi:hypothetical protein
MPEISRFLGIVIAMFYNEHRPPHFHAKYGEHQIVMNIETGDVMEGYFPTRALGLVREWHSIHKGDLLENWRFVEGRKTLKKIAPLE